MAKRSIQSIDSPRQQHPNGHRRQNPTEHWVWLLHAFGRSGIFGNLVAYQGPRQECDQIIECKHSGNQHTCSQCSLIRLVQKLREHQDDDDLGFRVQD